MFMVRISKDASHICSVSDDRTVKVWQVCNTRAIHMSSNGVRLVTALGYGTATFGMEAW